MAFKYGITLQQAKALQLGDYLYSNHFTNADGKTPKRWRINGKIKTWKTDPYRLQIPLKYGLYNHAYLVAGTIANDIYMTKITIELWDIELTAERAIEVMKEKGVIE